MLEKPMQRNAGIGGSLPLIALACDERRPPTQKKTSEPALRHRVT